MARHLVRLKLALIRGGLREAGTAGAVGMAAGYLFATGFGGLIGVLLLLARRMSPAAAGDLMAVVFLALGIGWAFGPVLALAADNTLDIDRLALFPLRAGQLMPGLLLAAPIGFGGLFSILIIVGATGGMAPVGAEGVLVVIAGVAELGLIVTASRLLSTTLSAATKKRRWRDVALFAGPVLALSINVAFQLVNRSVFRVSSRSTPGPRSALNVNNHMLRSVRAAVRWLPPGWAAQAMAAARRSDPVGALGGIAATIALTSGLVWMWWRAIRLATTTASDTSVRPGRRGDLIPPSLSWLPRSPAVAIGVKELRYAWRDPRQRGVLLGGVFAALVPFISFRFVHANSPRLSLLVVWPAVVIGSSSTNLFGFDAATWWTNVAAGTRIRADIIGRTAARLSLTAAICGVLLVGLVAISGAWFGVVPAFGLAVAGAGVSTGLGAITSVTTPVPVPPAGRSNMFGGGSAGNNAAAGGAALGVMFGTVALVAPLIVATFIIPVQSPLQLVVAAAGTALGVIAWQLGVNRATRRSSKREAELLAALSTIRS